MQIKLWNSLILCKCSTMTINLYKNPKAVQIFAWHLTLNWNNLDFWWQPLKTFMTIIRSSFSVHTVTHLVILRWHESEWLVHDPRTEGEGVRGRFARFLLHPQHVWLSRVELPHLVVLQHVLKTRTGHLAVAFYSEQIRSSSFNLVCIHKNLFECTIYLSD